jgi:hypothetical protein
MHTLTHISHCTALNCTLQVSVALLGVEEKLPVDSSGDALRAVFVDTFGSYWTDRLYCICEAAAQEDR